MTKFHFIGGIFLLVSAILPLVSLASWRSYVRAKRQGRTEQHPAQVRISRSSEQARQVHLYVELEDSFGDPVELCSRSTNKDWVSYEGSPITVHYDPDDPLQGWIELDFRRRQKVVLIITPLLLAIGAGVILLGPALG